MPPPPPERPKPAGPFDFAASLLTALAWLACAGWSLLAALEGYSDFRRGPTGVQQAAAAAWMAAQITFGYVLARAATLGLRALGRLLRGG